MTKFISWNVNGLRAAIKHGFLQVFNEMDADFFCIQETKLAPGQLDLDLPDYHQYWNYAEKKGYSGTAIFAKQPPLSVQYGINVPEFDHEGRVITLEYPDFYLINTYVPNSGAELKRLDFRHGFNEAFYEYVNQLSQQKSIVWCGDLNVAHQEIDLKNPQSNHHHPGFTDEERFDFSKLLKSGFTDTFRYFYLTKSTAILGGAIVSTLGSAMLAGGLIISLPQPILTHSWLMPRFMIRFLAVITVPSN